MSQYLTVQGSGTISATPDQIIIGFQLSQINREYNKSVSDLNKKLEQLYQSLEKEGIEGTQVKLFDYSVSANYEYVDEHRNKKVLTGYIASYSLQLEIDLEPKAINRVLGMVANSAQEVEISLDFTVKDTETFKNQALEKAITSAKSKAELIAKATGVTLGKIENITYGKILVEVRARHMEIEASRNYAPDFLESRDITPGDVSMSDDVTITWEIS